MANCNKMFQCSFLSTSHVNWCRMTFQNYNLFSKAFSHKKEKKKKCIDNAWLSDRIQTFSPILYVYATHSINLNGLIRFCCGSAVTLTKCIDIYAGAFIFKIKYLTIKVYTLGSKNCHNTLV